MNPREMTKVVALRLKVNIVLVIPHHLESISYKLDVRMKSPPASPPRIESGGASRVTGGILRGRAYGNVYNHADVGMMFDSETRMGKIHVYTTRVDPTLAKPYMVLKHKVTPKLKPILKALARGYSPVRSMLLIIFWIIFSIFCR
jgi:hypothetical protein